MSSAHGRRGGMAASGRDRAPSPSSDDEKPKVMGVAYSSERTTRSQAPLPPKNEPEDLAIGYRNCPECGCGTFFQDGCKTVHCRNEIHKTIGKPETLRFCIFCKKRCEEGRPFVKCGCPHHNSRANREMVAAQLAEPVELDEGEKEASSESAGGATTPSSDVSSGESSEVESRRQDSDDGSWKESDAGDEGGDPPFFVDDERSRSELTSGNAPPPAKRIKTEPVKSEEVETDEEGVQQFLASSRSIEVKMEDADLKDEETDTEASSGKDVSDEHRAVGAGEEETDSAGEKKPARKKSRARGGDTTAAESAPRARPRRNAAVKAAAKLSGDMSEEDSGSDGDSFALDDASSGGREGEYLEEEEVEYNRTSKSNQRRDLDQALKANKPNAFDERWNEHFRQLKAYKDEHGNCNVPRDYAKNPQLASWVKWQRQEKKRDNLSVDRMTLLNELEFQWTMDRVSSLNLVFDEQWMKNFEKLQAYKGEHGHCNVPHKYETAAGIKLGRWVNTQRNVHKNGELSGERRERLEEIGFLWRVNQQWNGRFELLQAYKAEHGHCNVPRKYETAAGIKLGRWVNTQRNVHKKGNLTKERKGRLKEIGFRF